MRLEARRLQIRLGHRTVVSNVDAVFEPGLVHAIVGPNGAGKTSLLRGLCGLERATSGDVLVDGRPIGSLRSSERAKAVGFVPQQVHLEFPFTVREVVAMGRYARRSGLAGPAPEDHKAIAAALEATRLGAFASRDVTRLSRGEHQRVLLARVLAQETPIVLLDEPTSNLDLAQAHHVHGILRRLASEGRTIVAVLHDLATASRIADRMLLLDRGLVVSAGRPREVLTAEHIEEAFAAAVRVAWDDEGARIDVLEEPKRNA